MIDDDEFLAAAGLSEAAARFTSDAIADYRAALDALPPASPYRDRMTAALRNRERSAARK